MSGNIPLHLNRITLLLQTIWVVTTYNYMRVQLFIEL
jgi:hypothetical protein